MTELIIPKISADSFFRAVDKFEYNRCISDALKNSITSIDLLVHPFYDLYDENARPVQLDKKRAMVSQWQERIETTIKKDCHHLLVYVDMDYNDEKFLLVSTEERRLNKDTSSNKLSDLFHYRNVSNLVYLNMQGVVADWMSFVNLQVEFMNYCKEVLGDRVFYPLEFEWHHETPDYDKEKHHFEGYILPYSDDEEYGVTEANFTGKKPNVYAYGCYLPGCVNDNFGSFLRALNIPKEKGCIIEKLSVPYPHEH